MSGAAELVFVILCSFAVTMPLARPKQKAKVEVPSYADELHIGRLARPVRQLSLPPVRSAVQPARRHFSARSCG